MTREMLSRSARESRQPVRRAGCALIAVLMGACAQASPPPGGDPDRSPPRIVETIPEQNAVVPGFEGPVRIVFDETLSERGPREGEMALVSPVTGEVEVERDGKELKVTIEGGWQPGRVYHVVILPGHVDRRGNARGETYELVFSTGPEILPTVMGGLVQDRLTGRAVAKAHVVAIGIEDTTRYLTLTDSAGFFSFRSLPLGHFRTIAYVDQNRDRELSGLEPRAEIMTRLVAATDTPIIELSVLALDTTPARLLRAEARDSQNVLLAFDDYITPTEQLTGVNVTIWALPDSVLHPRGGELLRQRDVDARARARADSLRAAADTARADTAAARPDTTPARPPEVARAQAADTARLLPSQSLVWIPRTPLAPGTRYRVTVFGIRNIGGVPGGGGSVPFETRAAPKPAAPDTTQLQPPARDTTQLRPPVPDTASVRSPRDTSAALRLRPNNSHR